MQITNRSARITELPFGMNDVPRELLDA